jgi:hypothetical protein
MKGQINSNCIENIFFPFYLSVFRATGTVHVLRVTISWSKHCVQWIQTTINFFFLAENICPLFIYQFLGQQGLFMFCEWPFREARIVFRAECLAEISAAIAAPKPPPPHVTSWEGVEAICQACRLLGLPLSFPACISHAVPAVQRYSARLWSRVSRSIAVPSNVSAWGVLGVGKLPDFYSHKNFNTNFGINFLSHCLCSLSSFKKPIAVRIYLAYGVLFRPIMSIGGWR